MTALRSRGLAAQFAAPPAAINTAKAFCTGLANGAKDQGSETQKVEVQYYCPAFAPRFYTLRKITVTGVFAISNESYDAFNDYATPNWTDGDNGCKGDSGYADLNSDTQVVVTDGENKVLARTSLGVGIPSGSSSSLSSSCTFTFSFPLTEGADQYVVSVGHRGSSNYSFSQLMQPNAVALQIGNN